MCDDAPGAAWGKLGKAEQLLQNKSSGTGNAAGE